MLLQYQSFKSPRVMNQYQEPVLFYIGTEARQFKTKYYPSMQPQGTCVLLIQSVVSQSVVSQCCSGVPLDEFQALRSSLASPNHQMYGFTPPFH